VIFVFNKHKEISSPNEIAHTLADKVICRLTKVIEFFQEEKILHVEGLKKYLQA
jgi:hypothetical protein